MLKPSPPGNEGKKFRAKRTINQPPVKGGLHYTRRSRIFNEYYPNPPWHLPFIGYHNQGKPWYELQTKQQRQDRVKHFAEQAQKIIKKHNNGRKNGQQLNLFD